MPVDDGTGTGTDVCPRPRSAGTYPRSLNQLNSTPCRSLTPLRRTPLRYYSPFTIRPANPNPRSLPLPSPHSHSHSRSPPHTAPSCTTRPLRRQSALLCPSHCHFAAPSRHRVLPSRLLSSLPSSILSLFLLLFLLSSFNLISILISHISYLSSYTDTDTNTNTAGCVCRIQLRIARLSTSARVQALGVVVRGSGDIPVFWA
ncbi:hypothetical protein DENSPDRAFT_286135 [Dentipellis sp. KUC8613]|nr:hypothetical protein DENSPDRAFT_286135 [Dentipellis sp. KUC8613]